ncbi:hypothetical protein [Niallia taxi]|uniref:hypothetical protein n=1 Tax=Niallia taxi TaxID=2499688 RepID=UPI0020426CE9|nr:hypothetical protein [Niallia taxi]
MGEAIILLFLGDIDKATEVINAEWFLFLPSLYSFSIYDSYVNTFEKNKLYDKEQRAYIKFQQHYFLISNKMPIEKNESYFYKYLF